MMKKFMILLLAGFLLFAAVSCGVDVEKLAAEEIYPDFPGSLAVVYDSMEQLEQDALLVAVTEVSEQKVIPLDGLPRTHSQVVLKHVLKGPHEEGAVIEVIEEGDVTQGLYLGVPQLEKGQEYILFLKEHEGNYFICGAFQGRFIIKEGYVFQQGAGDTKIDAYEPLKTEEFIEKYSE